MKLPAASGRGIQKIIIKKAEPLFTLPLWIVKNSNL